MELPQKLRRAAVKAHFAKIPSNRWEYLFDHEKENGLGECRVRGHGIRPAWYSTSALKLWLLSQGYYVPEDFEPSTPLVRQNSPWAPLFKRQAVLA